MSAHPNWSYPNDAEIVATAQRADAVACVLGEYGQAIMERLESLVLAVEAWQPASDAQPERAIRRCDRCQSQIGRDRRCAICGASN